MTIKGIGVDIHSPRVNGDLSILQHDLDYYARCGLDYVEIPVHGVDGILAGRLNERRVRQIKSILSAFPFGYSVHSPDSLNLFDIEHLEWHKDVLRATVAFAHEIGAQVVVYHGGRLNAGQEVAAPLLEQLKGIEREALHEMGELAAAAGVKIGVENGERDSYSSVIADLVVQVRARGASRRRGDARFRPCLPLHAAAECGFRPGRAAGGARRRASARTR